MYVFVPGTLTLVNGILFNAARKGEMDNLVDSIQKGGDVNHRNTRTNYTSLVGAAINGQEQCVKVRLDTNIMYHICYVYLCTDLD